MATIDDDDFIVRELDVYIANDLHAAATELCLCQFPLRPPWRPYDMDQVNSVRFKKAARRLEIDVPVVKDERNYNEDVEPFKKTEFTTLRSTEVDKNTSYAVGVLSGDKLILAPIDYCLQMRPSMTNLQSVKKPSANDEEEDEDAEEQEELAAVEVQVKKRETERQQMARLNSYAYLAQKEAEEDWIKLNVHASGTAVSDNIWDNFVKPTETPVGRPMDLASYLACIIPKQSDGQDDDGTPADANPATAAPEQTKASPEALAALPAVITALFNKHKTCSMANIRQFLLDYADAGPAKSVAALTDRALHEAVMGAGNLACVRRVYFQASTGKPEVDKLRAIVVDLLKEKESFRKSEVADIAKGMKGVDFTDTLFGKAVRELCFSRGNAWFLKLDANS